jgi:divalent metal cation (Fe/Co/Zn/Cd) transporter
VAAALAGGYHVAFGIGAGLTVAALVVAVCVPRSAADIAADNQSGLSGEVLDERAQPGVIST